jgi:hypothetical protein
MAVNLIDSNDISVSQTGSDIQLNLKDAVESGSNANGNYIKYGNGTMICWATKSATMGAWSSAGSLYQASNTSNITFPQTFYSKPVLNIQIDYTDSGFWQAWFGRSIYSTSEITYLQIWRTATGNTGITFTFDYIAIGRWK